MDDPVKQPTKAKSRKEKEEDLGIGEFIEKLKKDLLEEKMKGSDPLFEIKDVTVEVNFVVTKSLNGDINLQVVKADADYTTARTQRVILRMEPIKSETGIGFQAINIVDPARHKATIDTLLVNAIGAARTPQKTVGMDLTTMINQPDENDRGNP